VYEVSVADDVLTAQPDGIREFVDELTGWSGPVLFLVTPSSTAECDLALVAEAAHAAAERFALVTSSGVELPGSWAMHDDLQPDAVVEPRRYDDGVVVGAFCEDGITPPQADTMLRVLLGELHSRRLSARVSCPPGPVDPESLPVWPGYEPPEPRPKAAPEDRRWFVTRTLRCVTTTGVPYTETEWLQTDRTWGRGRSDALTLEQTDTGPLAIRDLIASLPRDSTDASRVSGVHGVLTSPDGEASGRVPPDTIRDHGHAWQKPGG
jgi:hypothetical protein